MEDQELRVRYNEAADQKEQVGILADLNGVPVAQMAEKLASIGCSVDKRWFSKRSPRPKKTAEDLMRQLDELGDRLNDTDIRRMLAEHHVAQRDAEISALRADLEAQKEILLLNGEELRRLREELLTAKQTADRLREQLTDAEAALSGKDAENERLRGALEAALGDADGPYEVICRVVGGKLGMEAYLWGELLRLLCLASDAGPDGSLTLEEAACVLDDLIGQYRRYKNG